MTITDLTIKLSDIAKNLENECKNEVVKTSLNAKALIHKTVLEKGFGAQYSNNLYPAYLLRGKEINQSGSFFIKNLIKKGNKENPALTNWGQFREAQGLSANFVNLSYSSKMLSSLSITRPIENNYRFTCLIEAGDAENQKKLNENYKRYGDFLTVLINENKETINKICYENIRKFVINNIK